MGLDIRSFRSPGNSRGFRLLLLSGFSRVQLCATPWTAAHQAPLSLGFSRQEHWSGSPFPSPMQESEGGANCKEPTYQCRRCGFDPWIGKIPWSRKRRPTPVFLLENPVDRGAWWATVRRVAESWTRLRVHTHTILKYKFESFDVLLFPSQILSKT